MAVVMNIRIILICVFSIAVISCTPNSDVNTPVNLVWDKLGKKTNQLIIFLPGLFDSAEFFKKEQFFSIARDLGIKADMVSASIHLDHLLEEKLIERIEKDIFLPAKDAGYDQVWFVGLSLGGLNSLLFYRKYSQQICGVAVLAPYLAGKPLANEILKAGGIMKWAPTPGAKLGEMEIIEQYRLWVWLKEQYAKNNLEQIYLGYGKKDMYVTSSNILASILTNKNVTVVEGKHDLDTARNIWRHQLQSRNKTGLFKLCK